MPGAAPDYILRKTGVGEQFLYVLVKTPHNQLSTFLTLHIFLHPLAKWNDVLSLILDPRFFYLCIFLLENHFSPLHFYLYLIPHVLNQIPPLQ